VNGSELRKDQRRHLGFMKRSTSEGTDLIPPQDRIATFDNLGTLFTRSNSLRMHSGLEAHC